MVGESAQGPPPAANNWTADGDTKIDTANIPITGERGDAIVHGFWERGGPCILT